MLGFGLPFFLMDPKMAKAQREREQRETAERLKQGVPWTPGLKWQPRLTITASTWPAWSLFSVEPSSCNNVNDEKDTNKLALSPNGRFAFYRKTLQRGVRIATMCGARRGNVMFDEPVAISALHERTHRGDAWKENPWMSVTPMELMTMRPGIRMARGHVVIAGLGLGRMVVDVMRKRSVTKVTLVERSQELVDWVMPAVAPMIRGLGKDFDTVVGDAYEILPTLTADIALVDIFESYGGNDFLRRRRCPNIPVVWSWGSATIGDR